MHAITSTDVFLYSVVVKIDDISELSYALIRQPVFSSWFVMTDHKVSKPIIQTLTAVRDIVLYIGVGRCSKVPIKGWYL